jgi:outer membrane protein assembly factor BamB
MMRFCFLFGSLLLLTPLALRADWPDYRGPSANGHASAPGAKKALGLPLHWSESENVKWKTAIHDLGWSTPVVMGGKVWLTTATKDGHDFYVLCVDAGSGKVLLDKKLFHADKPEPLGNAMNCYASPSPVLEKGRVYVHFGTYGTACLDSDSYKVLWTRDDLHCRHWRGPGSSPVVYKDLLILTMDGIDVQYIVALNKKTGKTVWKTPRSVKWDDLDRNGKPIAGGDLRKGYGTPIFLSVNGKTQMISTAAKALYSYDPETGKEIWQVRHHGHSSAARPVFGLGMVFLSTAYGKTELLAVRPDGKGDVTDSHVAWRTVRGSMQKPSPVLVDGLLYTVSDDGGVVTCLEAKNGKEVWRQRVGGSYSACLLYADGHLYCFSMEGKAAVLKAGRKAEVLATNKLADGFMASPAVSGKALILRTKTHLYRIEEGAKAPAETGD